MPNSCFASDTIKKLWRPKIDYKLSIYSFLALILASADLIMGGMMYIPKAIYSIYRFIEKSLWIQNTERKLITCKIVILCGRLWSLHLGHHYGTYKFPQILTID